MLVLACIVAFLAAAAHCAHRMRWAERAVACVPTGVAAVALWVVLLTMRTPTPGRALLAFLLVDLALVVICVLGVLRLLGGFDEAAGPGPGGWGEDEDDTPPVAPGGLPAPARRPAGVSGSRRSARGSGRRAPARSSSARSAPTRS